MQAGSYREVGGRAIIMEYKLEITYVDMNDGIVTFESEWTEHRVYHDKNRLLAMTQGLQVNVDGREIWIAPGKIEYAEMLKREREPDPQE